MSPPRPLLFCSHILQNPLLHSPTQSPPQHPDMLAHSIDPQRLQTQPGLGSPVRGTVGKRGKDQVSESQVANETGTQGMVGPRLIFSLCWMNE